VDQFKAEEFDNGLPKGDRLVAIFDRQQELMEKYHVIEARSGLLQTPFIPVEINSQQGQARLKDFAWRITEEVAEATKAYEDLHNKPEMFVENYALLQEEMADAMHFLVEFTILAGMKPHDVVYSDRFGKDMLDQTFAKITSGHVVGASAFLRGVGQFVKELGLACNYLKNRPWKQKLRDTDVLSFREQVKITWKAFSFLVYHADISSQELFELYFGKSDVNKDRQDSGY